MKMKTRFLSISSFLITLVVSNAAVTLENNAIINTFATDIANGDVGLFIVNEDGPFSLSPSIDIFGGFALTDSAAYGSSFTPANGTTTAFASGSFTFVTGNQTGFDLGNGVDAGDGFALVMFTSSTTTTLVGDTFKVWTDASWVIPATGDGAYEFGSDFATLINRAPNFTSTVSAAVPEPSTYALFAGILSVGFVAVRRNCLRSQS